MGRVIKKQPIDQLAMFLGGSAAKPEAAGMQWSDQQRAIFEAMRAGTGDNIAVRARAGTGKTTTAVEMIKRCSARMGRILYAAFNRDIKDAVKPKLAGLKNVDVKTLHGVGYGILLQYDPATTLDEEKGMRLARDVAPNDAPQKFVTAIKKAAAYFKSNMIDNADDGEGLLIDAEIDADPWANEHELAQLALKAMHSASQMVGLVDFDDQVWLAVQLGLRSKWGYDLVVIDEAQDTNESQFRLCVSALKPGGIIAIVGDEKQAIYQFRGADESTYAKLVERLGAKVYPLTRTYRCAQSIVTEANKYVPDLEARPNAPAGIVRSISPVEMRTLMKPGDFVLSRSNAALVEQCTAAIRAGIKSNIQGRDLGESLAALVRKARCDDIEELIEYVEAWRVKEVEKRMAKDRDTQPVLDRAACLLAFADGAKSIPEMLRNIAIMFEDTRDAHRVVFSTTHRAKGLERERVFVLRDTYLKPRPFLDAFGEKQFGVTNEEKNLYYVAVTRAISELYLVTTEGQV